MCVFPFCVPVSRVNTACFPLTAAAGTTHAHQTAPLDSSPRTLERRAVAARGTQTTVRDGPPPPLLFPATTKRAVVGAWECPAADRGRHPRHTQRRQAPSRLASSWRPRGECVPPQAALSRSRPTRLPTSASTFAATTTRSRPTRAPTTCSRTMPPSSSRSRLRTASSSA